MENSLKKLHSSKCLVHLVDMKAYSRKEWRQKLKYLVELASLNNITLGQILGWPPNQVSNFFDHDQEAFRADSEEDRQADLLLTILAFLLPVAQYQPEKFLHFFNGVGLFGDTASPPWNAQGLRNFLLQGGPLALDKAICFICRRP